MKFLLLLLCLLSLASCAGPEEKKSTPPLMSQKMATRMSKPDLNRRSIYDKSMQAALNPKSDSGAWFGRQKHHSKTFSGTKTFTETPGYKTDTFSRAGEKSIMGTQKFGEAGKVPADADSTFATAESPMAGQTAREASQTFAGANDTFKTSSNRDALKSQRKNDRPTFIQIEEYSKSPAYSEEQVRKLLGRD
jgi:hypothetical protein